MNAAGIVVNDYLRNLDDALVTATNAARSDVFLDAYVFSSSSKSLYRCLNENTHFCLSA